MITAWTINYSIVPVSKDALWDFSSRFLNYSLVFHSILFIGLLILLLVAITNSKTYIAYIKRIKFFPKLLCYLLFRLSTNLHNFVESISNNRFGFLLSKITFSISLKLYKILVNKNYSLKWDYLLQDPTRIMLKESRTYFREKMVVNF